MTQKDPATASGKTAEAAALKALRRRLPGCVFTDEQSRFRASLDNLRLSFLPTAVVKARESADVGLVLKLAHRHGVPVTARGAGSSATGSAVPLRGGWALDLSRLDSISIDPVARIATVGAGSHHGGVSRASRSARALLPPRPVLQEAFDHRGQYRL